ncbi:diguanylate cyclase [soil metagenome]
MISDELVQFVHVTDRQGFVIDTTAARSARNVADEEFFERHRRQNDLDVSIAPVWVDPIGGAPGIPVTRRLNDGAAFDGLVTANVNPGALSVAYARTEDKGTAIGVLGADGIFRSRTVDGKLTHGERAEPSRVVERSAEIHRTGLPTKRPIDGVSRFLSAVKVDKYPLYAVVAVDADNALATYRHTRDRVLTWAAVFAACALLAGWIVALQLRRLQTSRRRTRKAETTFRATLEGSLDAVTILAAVRDAADALQDLTVTDCNTLAASLVGRERQQILGQRLCELAPSMHAFVPQFERVIRERQSTQAQVAATEQHLLGRWLHHQLVPLEDGIALITRDVTDQRAAEEALAALARSDSLTQLPNRRHFEEVLGTAHARALRSRETMALMLAERAGSLQDVRDLSARIVETLRAPHLVAGRQALAPPSVGVAIFDTTETTATLCERADAAMYLAKRSGKSRYMLADAACDAAAGLGTRLTEVR